MSVTLRLHALFKFVIHLRSVCVFPTPEVLELCELLQPTEDEAAGRNAAVAAVTDVVKSIWPNATVAIFGSFATGGSVSFLAGTLWQAGLAWMSS